MRKWLAVVLTLALCMSGCTWGQRKNQAVVHVVSLYPYHEPKESSAWEKLANVLPTLLNSPSNAIANVTAMFVSEKLFEFAKNVDGKGLRYTFPCTDKTYPNVTIKIPTDNTILVEIKRSGQDPTEKEK